MTDEQIVVDAERRVRIPGPDEPGKYCTSGISGCGRWLSLDSFHRDRDQPSGLQLRCKSCKRQYRLRNPETVRRSATQQAHHREAVRSRHPAAVLDVYMRTGEVLEPRDPELTNLYRGYLDGGDE